MSSVLLALLVAETMVERAVTGGRSDLDHHRVDPPSDRELHARTSTE